jgi:hypothetical protein
VREAAGAQRLHHRQVRVRQVDVLADQRDRHVVVRLLHALQQVVPLGPVHVSEREVEPANDVRVQPLRVQHLGDVVDAGRVHARDDGVLVDVAHQRDLALDAVGDRPVRTAHDRVRGHSDLTQGRNGVLRRLGLQLA